ncbi:hypothetical protein [Thermodesulfovibrio sp. TK110]
MLQGKDRKIIVSIKNEEIYRAYSLLKGINRIVIETLFGLLLQKVSPVELQQVYIKSGEDALVRFIKEKLEETERVNESFKVQKLQNNNDIKIDASGFWE